jgi:hypothetical protein
MDDDARDEYQAELRKLRGELRAIQGGGEGDGVPQGTPPLRQRDILRALLAERSARSAHRSRATVRLTRNAKGDVQPEVLVEVSDEEAGEAIAKAQHEATRVFDALCLVYSLGATPPNGAGGGGHDA